MQNIGRRQKHSHGHNGQDFQCEKQSGIIRVSHGQHGQDFQCKNIIEGRNIAMVIMVRISHLKNSQRFWESVMVIMVKISNTKMLAEGRNTAMVEMVMISNAKSMLDDVLMY